MILDAKGFIIRQVMFVHDVTYDQMKFTIHLDSFYSNTDTFSLFIDYIARPNEQIVIEGVAIVQNKGLYFIKPLGEEPGKPHQICTQGQPESNSKWFPTFNERTSQKFFINQSCFKRIKFL